MPLISPRTVLFIIIAQTNISINFNQRAITTTTQHNTQKKTKNIRIIIELDLRCVSTVSDLFVCGGLITNLLRTVEIALDGWGAVGWFQSNVGKHSDILFSQFMLETRSNGYN